jgi:hypothetical protein
MQFFLCSFSQLCSLCFVSRMPRVGSCRFVPGACLRLCDSCRFVSKFVCVSRGSCHACRKFARVPCVSGSVRLIVFLCLCVSCMSRVMRVACHACHDSCVSCVSRVMRVWIGCGSVRVRVGFLRVCGSCLFLCVLVILISLPCVVELRSVLVSKV